MNRKQLLQSAVGVVVAECVLAPLPAAQAAPPTSRRRSYTFPATTGKHDMNGYGIPDGPPQKMAFLIYPGMTALDFMGPFQMLSDIGNVEMHVVWKTAGPVKADSGVQIVADTTFKNCPSDLTVLFAPGGSQGTVDQLNDLETLAFLAAKGKTARYVTSVCTGSLLLGAAGLLKGYKATSHWGLRDLLAGYGATPVEERVVWDRNRVTGAGVTAGLDFAIQLTAKLRNPKMAQAIQLGAEYDPQPPYRAGYPTEPDAAQVRTMSEAMLASLRQSVRETKTFHAAKK